MIRNISVGIDIGTLTTRVVVGEFLKGEKNPKIIGVGESETKGMRHGYVIHISDAVSSLKNALAMAKKTSEVKIKRAFVSIGGTTLRSQIGSGSAIISKADSEVTSLDVNKALEESEVNLNLGNKKIIYVSPISFRLDGKEVLGRPEGMHGNKLEIKAIFITSSIKHWEDLMEVVTETGVEPIDVIASTLAGSSIALSARQKMVGTALIDIGAETVSLGIFENESLISLHTFSIGSSDITNDIALGLKIPLEKAESFKIENNGEEYSKKKLEEIVEARLSDIFELIENHLKKIKRSELLPAGVVFIGGGANTSRLDDLSKTFLKLPSKIGTTEIFGNIKTKLRDPSWYVALGLVTSSKNIKGYTESSFSNFFKDLKNVLKSMLKQLMP
ncbi:MAG: cell division protein FtsA [Patescibacteria group bacterium]